MKTILITGTAGFIGFHLVQKLLKEGSYKIVGLDNINDYYDTGLKYDRLEQTGIMKSEIEYGQPLVSHKNSNYTFVKADLADKETMGAIFSKYNPDFVCNLAAQAGVRYSLENPDAYIQSNLVGFQHMIDLAKEFQVEHFIYASSSSVYGLNSKIPFSTDDSVDHPVSLYAATKKSNELVAHSYSHLYNLPTTGLRFFTVYGPWGRPDMAYFSFAQKIMAGKTIDIYNNGDMQRDFTFVDDVVNGIARMIDCPPKTQEVEAEKLTPAFSSAPYKVYNIGHNSPVNLMDFVKTLENKLGIKADINYMPMQPGDVKRTWANVEPLKQDFKYNPDHTIEYGMGKFVEWFKEYYNL